MKRGVYCEAPRPRQLADLKGNLVDVVFLIGDKYENCKKLRNDFTLRNLSPSDT